MGVPPSGQIVVRGLRKAFDLTPVLRGLDLRVEDGEVMTIFGPNGSGKTTLLKVLATLLRPTAGTVTIGGFDLVREAQAVRRVIGVVTHQTLLYEDLTVHENLKFYAKLYEVAVPDRRIQRVVHQVGLERRLHHQVRTLSHGMQKRVSIARAFLHDPPVLLLDEPETGLDQQALGLLKGLLLSSTADGRRRTVLMTTHSLERGLEVGSRVGILMNGRLVYEGDRRAMDLGALQATYAQLTGAPR